MKTVIHTDKAPKAIGPYVQAWKIGNAVYTSGQLGIDMATGALAEGVENQARCAMKNLSEVLAAAGAQCKDVVKTTVFVKDLKDFQTVNAVYATFFEGVYPARSCVQVAALPLNGLVEIECVAYVE